MAGRACDATWLSAHRGVVDILARKKPCALLHSPPSGTAPTPRFQRGLDPEIHHHRQWLAERLASLVDGHLGYDLPKAGHPPTQP